MLTVFGLALVFYGLSSWDAIRYRARRRRATPESGLHINYSYLLRWSKLIAASKPNARVLDYGCGTGKVVAATRELGLDAYGADIYYEASAVYKDEAARLGLFGTVIREIRNGRLDFDDCYFDLVMSNQVFEHVEDMDAALSEIHRVMKKGALFLCLFPSRDVIREGHIGIPFAHWFPRDSRLRFYVTLALRSIGLGYVKDRNKTNTQWTKDALRWLDNFTVYRHKREISRSFARFFEVKLIEEDYIKYRLSAHPQAKYFTRVLNLPFIPQISRVLFRKLAGMVILAKKPEEASSASP